MTQKQKDNIQKMAERSWEEDQKINPIPINPHAYTYGFCAAVRAVLENPSEWGLVKYEAYEQITKEWLTSKAENKRYREALERIAAIAVDYQPSIQTEAALTIAKEALKQEVNND